jgi:hypothetical protein
MALTNEEREEIKVLLKFPLAFVDEERSRIKSRGSYSITCFYFSQEAIKKTNHNFREVVLRAINGNNVIDDQFKLKNVKVKITDTNVIYINKFQFGSLSNVRSFERVLGNDFIKAGRLNRIYTEYILERMKYLFNDKS